MADLITGLEKRRLPGFKLQSGIHYFVQRGRRVSTMHGEMRVKYACRPRMQRLSYPYGDFELHDFSIELSLDLVQLSLARDSNVYRAGRTWRYSGIYESRHRREI